MVTGDGAFELDEVGELAHRFRVFADTVVRRLPLYHRLCAAASEDRDVAGLLLDARPDQRIPNLVLAAVHHLLLGGAEDPLADWYGSVTPHPRPVGTGEADPWPHFRRLALEAPEVRGSIATRATQTNEVGRCAPMLLALDRVARHAPSVIAGRPRSLGIVEVGASAGLNLLFDRYGYRYTADPNQARNRAGAVGELHTGSPLVLECELRGTVAPHLPDGFPHVSSRIGLDLEPVDLHHRDQARWLVACQWPDQPERLHRTRTAIALAHGDLPTVARGDAVDDVAPLVRDVAPVALPVVTATWALSYLPEARQRAFVAELDRLGTERDLSLVFAEQPVEVPGLPVPPRPDGQPDGRPTALVAVHWRDGVRAAERLADQHPHGTWLEWVAAP